MPENHPIPSRIIAYSIAEQAAQEALWDGIKAAVWLYYENYTDATDIDDGLLPALERLVEHTNQYAEDLHLTIAEAENDYNADPDASRNSEGKRRTVKTKLPIVDDGDDD